MNSYREEYEEYASETPSHEGPPMRTSPHPFRPMHGSDVCWECDEHVYAAIHQPPLPKWIKCERGHVLELTEAYRFVTCPWCHGKLIVQW
jgi:DNA-directed RNA polymerase subunit RPC12/RpoP